MMSTRSTNSRMVEEQMIRVILADKERVVAGAIARLVDAENDMRVTATYHRGDDLIHGLQTRDADVVVLDPAGLTMMGFRLLQKLRTIRPQTSLVVLTASQDEGNLFTAIRAGVRGYISKFADVAEIPNAIRAVGHGTAMLSSHHAAQLLDTFARQSYETTGLAPRQRDLLVGLVQGKSNGEIARDLRLTEKTVKNYMQGLFSALGARNRTEAAVRALEMDLVSMSEGRGQTQDTLVTRPFLVRSG